VLSIKSGSFSSSGACFDGVESYILHFHQKSTSVIQCHQYQPSPLSTYQASNLDLIFLNLASQIARVFIFLQSHFFV
jgi:hypothetical protein